MKRNGEREAERGKGIYIFVCEEWGIGGRGGVKQKANQKNYKCVFDYI